MYPKALRSRPARITATLTALLLAAVVSACGGGAAEAAAPTAGVTEQQLYEAAKQEGELTVYVTNLKVHWEQFLAAFTAKYPGITVSAQVSPDQASVLAKADAERQSGSPGADMLMVSDMGYMRQHAKAGDFATMVGPAFSSPDVAAAMTENGQVAIAQANQYGIAWNTTADQTGLTDWGSLLDPRLKGRIGLRDGTNSTDVIGFYMKLQETYGSDYLDRLAAQQPRVYTGSVPLMQAVASGEVEASGFVTSNGLSDAKANSAVDGVFPEPRPASPVATAIAKQAPHPNAAQLMANFQMTVEGQQAYSANTAAALPGVPGSTGSLADVSYIDSSTISKETTDQFVARWRQLFG
jgi:iron(III) transport system substrate-binding protein